MNPLPNHDAGRGGNVNSMEVINDAQTPKVQQLVPCFEQIFEFIVKEGHHDPKIEKSGNDLSGLGCASNGGTPDHVIIDCQEFKDEDAKLINNV